MQREHIKDWTGKIIGTLETKNNGDKVIKDFYGRIKGTYVKKLDMTKDFYGRPVGKGDQLISLLYR
jgi:hypothetical protein